MPEAASCLQRWRKSFPSTTGPSVAQSPLVPAEPSPHSSEQPADLGFPAEQVVQRLENVGSTGSSVRLTGSAHTRDPRLAAPHSGRGPCDLQRTALTETPPRMHTVYFQKCELTIGYIHRLSQPALHSKTNAESLFHLNLEEEWDALSETGRADVLKPAVLHCGRPTFRGWLHPDPQARCQEHLPAGTARSFRQRQLVPGARSAILWNLYSKKKERKQSSMKLNSASGISELLHPGLHPNCSGCPVVWH